MPMNPIHDKTTRELTSESVRSLGGRICAVVLYGSVARGEAASESDIDVLVIGDPEAEDALLDISYEVDLRNNTATSVFFSAPEDFERHLKLGSPFAEEVLNSGVALHDDGTFKRLREQVFVVGG